MYTEEDNQRMDLLNSIMKVLDVVVHITSPKKDISNAQLKKRNEEHKSTHSNSKED